MGSEGTAEPARGGFSGLTSSKVQVMHSNPKIEAQAAPKKPCLIDAPVAKQGAPGIQEWGTHRTVEMAAGPAKSSFSSHSSAHRGPKAFWEPSRSKGAAAGLPSCLLVRGAEQMAKHSLAEPSSPRHTKPEGPPRC